MESTEGQNDDSGELEIVTIARQFAAESTREGKVAFLLRNDFRAEEVDGIIERIENGFSFYMAISGDPGYDRIEVKAS